MKRLFTCSSWGLSLMLLTSGTYAQDTICSNFQRRTPFADKFPPAHLEQAKQKFLAARAPKTAQAVEVVKPVSAPVAQVSAPAQVSTPAQESRVNAQIARRKAAAALAQERMAQKRVTASTVNTETAVKAPQEAPKVSNPARVGGNLAAVLSKRNIGAKNNAAKPQPKRLSFSPVKGAAPQVTSAAPTQVKSAAPQAKGTYPSSAQRRMAARLAAEKGTQGIAPAKAA